MNLKTILILAMALIQPAFAENTLNYNLVEFNESATVTVPNDTMHIKKMAKSVKPSATPLRVN